MALSANQTMAMSMPDLQCDTTGLSTTKHERLQLRLSSQKKGGPLEQSGSAPARLRNTRGTEVLHSFLEEPLSSYKSLEPCRPRWKTSFRRFHLTDGIRVIDQDTICVSARDQVVQTSRKGRQKTSTGHVTYSASHREKLELDVEQLTTIVKEGVPGGGHAWSPQHLERVFRERTGRKGIWAQYEVPFREFLRIFPKTFELFGPKDEYVAPKYKTVRKCMDTGEDAMVRLARARENGMVDPPHGARTVTLQAASAARHLQNHRVKASFVPYAQPKCIFPQVGDTARMAATR